METRIKLTALEIKILKHRLEAYGSIEEALEGQYEFKVTESIVDYLFNGLGPKNILHTKKADAINDKCATAVLVDCIEGSTYIGTMTAIESDAKINATIRSMTQLARKIESARGLDSGSINVPTY